MVATTLPSTKTREYRKLSKVVREVAGLRGSPYPIEIVEGFREPESCGKLGHYTTPAGKYVRFPNAYRRAFGRPIYNCSTVRILVGAGWLIENGLA